MKCKEVRELAFNPSLQEHSFQPWKTNWSQSSVSVWTNYRSRKCMECEFYEQEVLESATKAPAEILLKVPDTKWQTLDGMYIHRCQAFIEATKSDRLFVGYQDGQWWLRHHDAGPYLYLTRCPSCGIILPGDRRGGR